MDVSIIIVNWNARDELLKCLKSIYEETKQVSFEIIVVDNASSDGSSESVKERFPQVKVIDNTENKGFSKANNQGIKEAEGKYILLLNPDMLITDRAIEKLYYFIEKHPEVGAVGPKLLDQKGKFVPSCLRSIPGPKTALYRLLNLGKLFPKVKEFNKYNLTYIDKDETQEVEAISGAATLARREAIDQVGLLDESFFMYGEDLDWYYRFSKAGWKIYYVPEAVIIHYCRISSNKRRIASTFNFYQAMYIFNKKHFAGNQFFLWNWAITAAIFLSGAIALIISLAKGILRGKR